MYVGADSWSSQTTPTGKTTPLSAAELEWQPAADAWASSTTGSCNGVIKQFKFEMIHLYIQALKVVREDRAHVRGVLKPVKRLMHGLLEATVQQLLRPVQRQTRGLSLEVPHQRQMIGPLLGPATQLPEVVHHWPIIGLLPEAVIQLPEVVRREQMLGLLHLEQRIPEHLLEVVGVVKEGPILGNAVVLELVMVRIPGPHRAVMVIHISKKGGKKIVVLIIN